MAKAKVKIEKNSFASIYRDLSMLAERDGKKVIDKMAGQTAIKLIQKTPVRTGKAASAWVPSARKFNVSPPSIVPRKGVRDQRAKGEKLGRVGEKQTKLVYYVKLINHVKHFYWIERRFKVISRAMKELRGTFAPSFTKALRAGRSKVGKD